MEGSISDEEEGVLLNVRLYLECFDGGYLAGECGKSYQEAFKSVC